MKAAAHSITRDRTSTPCVVTDIETSLAPQNCLAVERGHVGRLSALGQPRAEVGDGLAVEHQSAIGFTLDPQRPVEAGAQRLKIFSHVLRLSGERALC